VTEFFFDELRWPLLLIALAVFGFVPGLLTRIMVLAYRRDDPRRRELMAEVYRLPFIQRPVWLAQLAEVAICDGLAPRIQATLKRHQIGSRISSRLRRAFITFVTKEPDTTYCETFLLLSVVILAVSAEVYLPISARSGMSLAIIIITTLVLGGLGQLGIRRVEGTRESTRALAQRIEVVLLAITGPVACALVAFSVIHDIGGLSTGNLSHGYWVGLALSAYVFMHLLESFKEIKRTATREAADTRDGPRHNGGVNAI
jgi:hypothetical protein